MSIGPLVDVAWLAGHLADANLLVFDTTKYLPNEPGDGFADYRAGHIPGARYWDADLVSDPDSDLPSTVPSAARFAAAAGRLGIGPGVRVVFYDRKGLSTAARAWWLLGLFGHDEAAVLDGGLPKWVSAGHPLDDRIPPPPAPRVFTPSFRATRLRGIGDVVANLESRAELVVDARAASRFAGNGAEPRPGLRSGHIPGSRNLPYTALLETDFTFPDRESLRRRLAAVGIDGSTPVVTTCGSGVSAAILNLGLVLAGLPLGALYDGSWTEWGGRADTPVERRTDT